MSHEDVKSRDGSTVKQTGFAAQSLWLKLLLVVSVGAVVVGIVRCSVESTAPVAGSVSSVAVMPVRVEAPEGFFPQPSDSVAVVAAKWFTRSFARESGIAVDMVKADAVPAALAEDAGYDALAYFTLERTHDEEKDEYGLHIHGEMIHSVTKRPVTVVDYNVPPAFLYRRMTEAGERMARSMGYAPPTDTEEEG